MSKKEATKKIAPKGKDTIQKTFQGNLINNVFLMGKKIGAGNFGDFFWGKNIHTDEIIGIKMESTILKSPQLPLEFHFYSVIGPAEGFPKIHYYGQFKTHNALVMELLGTNLEDMNEMFNRKFSLKTVCMIAMQVIKRIKTIHKAKLLYRDIKPENFVVGRDEKMNIIFIVDFGLAKTYIDNKTGNHIPYMERKNLIGTARYMGSNVHRGIESSRRDDLEAIGNMIVYFFRGTLPWQGIKSGNVKERYQKIGECKIKITNDELCKGCPKQMIKFFDHVKQLEFEDAPNYDMLYSLMESILKENNQIADWQFDWMSNKFIDSKNKILSHPSQQDVEDKQRNKGVSVVALNSNNSLDSEKPVYICCLCCKKKIN